MASWSRRKRRTVDAPPPALDKSESLLRRLADKVIVRRQYLDTLHQRMVAAQSNSRNGGNALASGRSEQSRVDNERRKARPVMKIIQDWNAGDIVAHRIRPPLTTPLRSQERHTLSAHPHHSGEENVRHRISSLTSPARGHPTRSSLYSTSKPRMYSDSAVAASSSSPQLPQRRLPAKQRIISNPTKWQQQFIDTLNEACENANTEMVGWIIVNVSLDGERRNVAGRSRSKTTVIRHCRIWPDQSLVTFERGAKTNLRSMACHVFSSYRKILWSHNKKNKSTLVNGHGQSAATSQVNTEHTTVAGVVLYNPRMRRAIAYKTYYKPNPVHKQKYTQMEVSAKRHAAKYKIEPEEAILTLWPPLTL